MAKANPFMEMIAKKKEMAKGKKEMPMKKMASGGITSAKMGSVKTAAPSRDGIASKGKTKGKNQTPAFTAIIARDKRLLRLPMHLPASPLQSLKLVAAPASEPSANNTMAQQPWPWC